MRKRKAMTPFQTVKRVYGRPLKAMGDIVSGGAVSVAAPGAFPVGPNMVRKGINDLTGKKMKMLERRNDNRLRKSMRKFKK